MDKLVPNIPTHAGWTRCTKSRPCPICGKPDWCGVSSDGAVAHCMRTPSDREARNGGWIHKLKQDAMPPLAPVKRLKTTNRPAADFRSMLAYYQASMEPADLDRLALELGVSSCSLRRLEAAWSGPHQALAFPMYSPELQVIGIRLRSCDGRKWAVGGSRSGLFIPGVADGGSLPPQGPILICEGPTDTAAMLDLGFFSIGRPSCIGCEEMIGQLCRRRDVVIVADNDQPKPGPDGRLVSPGREGAHRLATFLHGRVRSIKIIYPLKGKDARAWLLSGATRTTVTACIAQAYYWRPANGG